MKKIFGVDYPNIDLDRTHKAKLDKSYQEKEDKQKKENQKVPIFLNVGRHDEKQKQISRILDATYKLNENGFKFKVLLVGKGTNTKDYEEIIKEKKLNNVILLGARKNPYP